MPAARPRRRVSPARFSRNSCAHGRDAWEFCRAVADMGLTAIDLLEEPEWAVAREHGLTCSMGYAGGGSIRDGLNVTANHDAIVQRPEFHGVSFSFSGLVRARGAQQLVGRWCFLIN